MAPLLDIAVTAMGLASPLGRTVAGACAAARAGLDRIGPLDGLRIDDPDLGEIAVTGHVARSCADGFEGLGRLSRLAGAALEDLARGTDWRPAADDRSALYLALPGGYLAAHYYGTAADELGPEAGVERGDVERMFEENRRGRLQQHLLPTVARLSGFAVDVLPRSLLFDGTVGLMNALCAAGESLRRGEVDRCLVGAVDSWVDPVAAELLNELDLLQMPGLPRGVIPGEAAAFFLLEDPAHTRATPLGIVRACQVEPSGVRRFEDRPPDGRAEANAIRACVDAAGPPASPLWTICDMTGDVWRAQEWGTALTFLPEWIGSAPSWFTGPFFGEAGAANPAIGLCMALHAIQRRRPAPPSALISVAGYEGGRGCALVAPAA